LYLFKPLQPIDNNSADTISALFLLEIIGFIYRKRYNTTMENKPIRAIDVGKDLSDLLIHPDDIELVIHISKNTPELALSLKK
jgi:hypothetical protein